MSVVEVNVPYGKLMEKRRRVERAMEMQPPEGRVPVVPGTYGSRFWCPQFGVSYAEYFHNPAMQLQWQFKWPKWAWENVATDETAMAIRPDPQFYTESWAYGCELGLSDESPWIKSHPIKTAADIDRLAKTDYENTPARQYYRDTAREMMKLLPDWKWRFSDGVEYQPETVIHPDNGTIGMFTLAADLRGPEIYLDVKLRPQLVHDLMQAVTELTIKRLMRVRKEFDLPAEGSYLVDDSSAALGPDDYMEFVYPYNKRYQEHFGGRNYVHCDARADHLLPIWAHKLEIKGLLGFGYQTSRKLVAEHLGGQAVLTGNVNPFLIHRGTPDQVYADAMDALEHFAHFPGFTLTSGAGCPPLSPLENINMLMRAAEDFCGAGQ